MVTLVWTWETDYIRERVIDAQQPFESRVCDVFLILVIPTHIQKACTCVQVIACTTVRNTSHDHAQLMPV